MYYRIYIVILCDMTSRYTFEATAQVWLDMINFYPGTGRFGITQEAEGRTVSIFILDY